MSTRDIPGWLLPFVIALIDLVVTTLRGEQFSPFAWVPWAITALVFFGKGLALYLEANPPAVRGGEPGRGKGARWLFGG